jgi:hypothetical protein
MLGPDDGIEENDSLDIRCIFRGRIVFERFETPLHNKINDFLQSFIVWGKSGSSEI